MPSEIKKHSLERQIKQLFISHPSDQFTRKELMAYLNIDQADYDLVHKILCGLSQKGFLHRTRQDHGTIESIPLPTFYYRLIHDHGDKSFNEQKVVMVAKGHYKPVNVPLNNQDSGFSKVNLVSQPIKILYDRYIDQDKKEYLYHHDNEKNQVIIFGAHDKSNTLEISEISIGDPIVGLKDVYVCYGYYSKKRTLGLMITNVKVQLARKLPSKKDVRKLVKKTIDLYFFPGRTG